MKQKLFKNVLLTTALLLLTGSVCLAADTPEAETQAADTPAADAPSTDTPKTEPPKGGTSNKWRMSVSGNAESDGTIVLQLSPKGGTALTATIAISNKNGENDVAKAIVKALKAQLPKEKFHVERDDGEDVLIKKKGRSPDFGLEVISNDVKNVRLSQRKE